MMELKLLGKLKEKVKGLHKEDDPPGKEDDATKENSSQDQEVKDPEELQSDEYHKKLMKDIKKYSEEIEEKFDKKISNFKIEEEEPPDTSKMEENFNDLKKAISEARKNGHYMFAAHNLLLQFPTALRIAQVTGTIEDIQKAERILKDAEKEYDEWKDQTDEDFSKKLHWKEKEVNEQDESRLDYNRQPSSPAEFFYLTNGHVLKTINDLKMHLEHMPDEIFEYHVDEKKNDFANWLKKVFRAKDLASTIITADSREKMKSMLEEAQKKQAAKAEKKEANK